MTNIDITYRPNPHYSENTPDKARLFAHIDLSGLGVEEIITDLPIYFRNLDKPIGSILQTYSTWIAGLFLEKGNLGSLEKTIDLYLRALIHYGRLPDYVFKLKSNAWPIYSLADQLVTRYPGNPVMGAATIGELHESLADYFKLTGFIRHRDELEVLYLSRSDLRLYRPVCALSAAGIADIPAFPVKNGQGMTLSAPVNTQEIHVSCQEGAGVLVLYDAVSAYLLDEGKIGSSIDLTINKLSPQVWDQVRTYLEPSGRYLSYYEEDQGRLVKKNVPVFANGKYLVAAETNGADRTALHVGPNLLSLQNHMGHELHHRGHLPSPDYVTVTNGQ